MSRGSVTAAESLRFAVGGEIREDCLLLARVLGITPAEFARRALEDAVDAGMADEDVRTAIEAMKRLEAKQAALRNGDPGRLSGGDDGSEDHGPRSGTGPAVDEGPSPRAVSPDEHPPDGSAPAPPTSGSSAGNGVGAGPDPGGGRPPRNPAKAGGSLYDCRPYKARISAETCAMNAAAARRGDRSRRECRGCPGVVKLAAARRASDAAKRRAS